MTRTTIMQSLLALAIGYTLAIAVNHTVAMVQP